jgi:hypothetical protein
MNRTRFILVVTIVLVLGAGVVVGRLWANLPSMSHGEDKPPPSFAKIILKLTADQDKQMDSIWADVHQKIDETFEQRKTLDREHDQAISALLSPEQYISYEEIQQEYRDGRGELDKLRQKLVHDGEIKSIALLDAEQKKLWDQMPHRPHLWGHGSATSPGGGGARFGFDGSPPHGPSTRPSHTENQFDGH